MVSLAALAFLAALPALAGGPAHERARTAPGLVTGGASAPLASASPGLDAPPGLAPAAQAAPSAALEPEKSRPAAADALSAALPQALAMAGRGASGPEEKPSRLAASAFDGSRNQDGDDPYVGVMIGLRDPGSPSALLSKAAAWKAQYGYLHDFSFEPAKVAGPPPQLVIRGAVKRSRLGWLRAAEGVFKLVPSVSGLEHMAFVPYLSPAGENAFRRLARRAYHLSAVAALMATAPIFLVALPALLSPVAAMGALWGVDRPLAVAIAAAGAGMFSIVSPFDQLTGRIPRGARLAFAQAGLLAAAGLVALEGHLLVAGLGAAASAGVYKAFSRLLEGGHSNDHPVDKFVNGLAVNAAITALGGAIAALGWAGHQTFAVSALVFSIAVLGLMGGYAFGRPRR